jgi:ADP-ribosyl-[dinitrogen reductase] hydrolase
MAWAGVGAQREAASMIASSGFVEFEDRVRGCLLAGAVGDALGAPVEFDSWGVIQARYGPVGVTRVGPPGHFTDDTQMTLFTCEALIRSRQASPVVDDPTPFVRTAYLRWLHTQGERSTAESGTPLDGWLLAERRLYRREAPGNTCIAGLRSGGRGTPDRPINDSKGCGGVMRAAPAGLFHVGDPEAAYRLGCGVAAVTHGHPDGWRPAGALAAMVALIADGANIRDAGREAVALTGGPTAVLLGAALDPASESPPDPLELERRFGGGWVGEEALAIAARCAVSAPDLRSGLLAAVNHSGDADSTGSICGNLLGALAGRGAIPEEWLDAVDACDVVEVMAADVSAVLTRSSAELGAVPGWAERYPLS